MGFYSYVIFKNPILMHTLRACHETRKTSTLRVRALLETSLWRFS